MIDPDDFAIPMSRNRMRALVIEAFSMGAMLHKQKIVELSPELEARLQGDYVAGENVCGALAKWLVDGLAEKAPATLFDLVREGGQVQ